MLIKRISKYVILPLIYVILLMASTNAAAFSQARDDTHPFGIFFDDETSLKVDNNAVRGEFLFEIPEDGYLYRDALGVAVDDPRITADMELPPAEIKHDPFQEKDVPMYHNQLVLPVTFTLPAGILPEEITGTLSYQGCADKICYRMMRRSFTFRLAPASANQVTANMDGASPGAQDTPDFSALFKANDFGALLARGWAVTLLVTFLAGVLTSFTPCVLPVIPLTLAFMGVGAHDAGWRKLGALSIFSIGMIAMYAVLGVTSAGLGKTLGFWFQSRGFQVFLVIFFTVMALWMLGVINFGVPALLQNAIVRVQPQGTARHLYAGITVGFLAAPCVGPVVGPLLVYISLTGNLVAGTVLMASYAAGLSVLFFVLSYFSRGWVARFGARSGALKKVLGVLLLTVAGFYAYVLVKPFVVEAKKRDLFFHTDLDTAEKLAATSAKGVLVDFFAEWCLPCHEWDKKVWADKGVRARVAERFVPVKIDCTTETPECKSAVERFGIIGWPSIVFIGPGRVEWREKRLVGAVLGAEEFLQYLDGVR